MSGGNRQAGNGGNSGTMTTGELLGQLRRRDIRLSLDGERLRVNAPKGALTSDLQAVLNEQSS